MSNDCNESGMAGLGAAHGSARRWCRWILNNGDQCKGKPLPITSVAGRKDLCPVHAYLEGDFDEAHG